MFVYFEKGDMKPPLAVYFSGYRTQEGFEGYYMMRGFGCPFILVTDPRSEGGAFYLGDSEFEQMITDYVTDKLDELGLTRMSSCSQELRWEPSVHYTMAQSFHHMHCFLQSHLPTWEM